MKNISTLFAGLVSSASTVVAQIATCDGNQSPDWDDCDAIYAPLRSRGDYINGFYPSCTALPAPDGVDPDSLNCKIAWCPNGADVQTQYSSVAGDYDLLNINCNPAGGGANGFQNTYVLQVTNNENFEPSSKRVKGRARRSTAQVIPRQAQDDTGFTLVTSSRSVERDGFQITGGLTSGSMYTISETDETSTTVSVSTEVGASFFEFFSTSVGTEVSSEQSTSNTVGISINIPCDADQRGQVFWYPLYDVYSGFTTPSMTNVDVIVPQDNDVSDSNYRVNCIN